jgi:hypothetical protein
MTKLSRQPGNRWLLVHTLGIAFSLSHVMLDMWAGVLGPLSNVLSGSLSVAQVLILLVCVTVYALWVYTLVLSGWGSRGSLLATMGLAALGSLNGLTIVYCPPPCAFPVGDISHFGSLVFCLWAIFESWYAFWARPSIFMMQAEEGDS